MLQKRKTMKTLAVDCLIRRALKQICNYSLRVNNKFYTTK